VAVKGWTETAAATVVDVARRARDAGAIAVLYTDVGRDGTERGPNLEDTANLARTVDIPILASGGVGTLAHLQSLSTIPGVAGSVLGRALYTGAIDLRTAIDVLASSGGSAAASDGGGVGGGRRGPLRPGMGGGAPLRD
jgi:phosphoribosylformimino-5-aminoimidazole carboxamide ribotide isomerase